MQKQLSSKSANSHVLTLYKQELAVALSENTISVTMMFRSFRDMVLDTVFPGDGGSLFSIFEDFLHCRELYQGSGSVF